MKARTRDRTQVLADSTTLGIGFVLGICGDLVVFVGEQIALGVVVVVEAGLAGVEVWWGDPFGAAVGADAGGPVTFFDEPVVWSAGQYQFVDVGAPAAGPAVFGV